MNILNSPGRYSRSICDKEIKKSPHTTCQSLLISGYIQQWLQIILYPQHDNQVSKHLHPAQTIIFSVTEFR